jgi:hypothetical protein
MTSPSAEELACFQKQVAQMQTMIARFQQPGAPAVPNTPLPPAAALLPSAPSAAPITPYQSMQPFQNSLPAAPRGHPSVLAVSLGSSSQPFLGFNNIGVSLTGQVNQQRLSSSAASTPQHATLPTHGHHCTQEPAEHPPSLLSSVNRSPDVSWCVTEIFLPGGQSAELGYKVTIKVYHPQVSQFATN